MTSRKMIGWGLFTVLTLISLLHIYWGYGGLWPADSVRDLIDLVIGDARFERMPPKWMTLIVAGLIAAAGWMALEKSAIIALLPSRLVTVATWCLIVVFALRGLSTYLLTIGLRETSPYMTEAFQKYDSVLYAPLCLAIAAAFLILGLRRTS